MTVRGDQYSGAGSVGWKKSGKRSGVSRWSSEREEWKEESRKQSSKIESRKGSMDKKDNVWNNEIRNQGRHRPEAGNSILPSEQGKPQDDSLLKCQIRELKDYIVKLEDDKNEKMNATNKNKDSDNCLPIC